MKPNQKTHPSQEELDILEASEYTELVDGYKADDLNYTFDF